jgi:hypothetical protein
MAETPSAGPIKAEDFVDVVDKTTGEPLPDPIPKHWIGTDLAPNVKRGTGRKSATDATGGGGSDGPPAKSASKPEWVAYATDEARGADRMSAEDAEKATRDELAAKFGG